MTNTGIFLNLHFDGNPGPWRDGSRGLAAWLDGWPSGVPEWWKFQRSIESQIMKYKLATLPRGTAKLPVLNLGYSAITLKQGASLAITPQTLNYLDNEQTFETSGYSATIADVRLMADYSGLGINTEAATTQNTQSTLGTNVSKTVIGSQINLRATTVNTLFGSQTSLVTTLTVVGLDSGARITIPVTINKTT